ncbi:hypothetical protein Adeh_2807 [Anaeromyxobacter dehalogenans 2CP-C]|uniref:Uncharacterized protein n=1 Tax=Anaeromyxobacter dehalogenans (strain 2CP-C) TaxID=290397 RepID=Q2ILQ1_ANADE|nr:hypothetical protein Adeh_2807 [Anaeromyxobacter dehalogenans 2CP-C]
MEFPVLEGEYLGPLPLSQTWSTGSCVPPHQLARTGLWRLHRSGGHDHNLEPLLLGKGRRPRHLVFEFDATLKPIRQNPSCSSRRRMTARRKENGSDVYRPDVPRLAPTPTIESHHSRLTAISAHCTGSRTVRSWTPPNAGSWRRTSCTNPVRQVIEGPL